jgi:hypothetical protein
MAVPTEQFINQFKGCRNDENAKQISPEYFYKLKNYDFPKTGVLGLDKILMPEVIISIGSASIDGLYEYRYLDQSNVLQTKNIVVTNGQIWSTDFSTTTLLKSGLSTGKVSFATFNDKLYIANGKDYVQVYDGNLGVVSEMGAPLAVESASVGNPNGAYYYAMTLVTAGGEEVLGSVSNTLTVVNKQIELTLPFGYAGTLTRNIYRTKAGGSTLYLVANIPDNTTLTYTDDTADASLVAVIVATGAQELPKPYFLAVAGQRLYGTKVTKFPTQAFSSDVNLDIWDVANFIDVANYADDNTSIEGIGVDFNKVLVGSGRNMFMIDPIDNSVVKTRANIGIKNGYSCQTIPAFGDFPGGLAFLSTQNDVRVMSGLQALPVATSLDNVSSQNWAQAIRGDLNVELTTLTNCHSAFYQYKYHLVLNQTTYCLDIRIPGWTEHYIKSKTYLSQPLVLSVMGNLLYNGQPDGSIEKEYQSIQYKTEDVEAYLQSPYIGVSNLYKFIENMKLWFIPSASNELNVTLITDDNQAYSTTQTFSVLAHSDFTVNGGAYNQNFFSKNFFNVDLFGLDYRVININRPVRWFQWTLSNTIGNISLQGVSYRSTPLNNKEG